MKYNTNLVDVITRRLDVLQMRYDHLTRLQQTNRATVEQKIFSDLTLNYERGLDCLLQLKAKEEYRAYDTWYREHLNGRDPP